MNATDRIRIHRLTSDAAGRFADMDTYTAQRPDEDFLRSLLADDGVFALVATEVATEDATEDAPAIALYTKLGVREDVLHFDIAAGN